MYFTISLRRSDSIASCGFENWPSTLLCWAITVSIPLSLLLFTGRYAIINTIALPLGPSICVEAYCPRWLFAMCVVWCVQVGWIHWHTSPCKMIGYQRAGSQYSRRQAFSTTYHTCHCRMIWATVAWRCSDLTIPSILPHTRTEKMSRCVRGHACFGGTEIHDTTSLEIFYGPWVSLMFGWCRGLIY